MAIHRIESQVTGTVWKIERQAGAGLAEGDTILVIESMKMEIPVLAEVAGVVEEIIVKPGDVVRDGDPMVIIGRG